MDLASRICRAPAVVRIAVSCVLCLVGVSFPARAETVRYDYVLDIMDMKGAVAESPFDLSEEVQIFGSFTLGTTRDENAPGNSAGARETTSITDSVFAFSWETGSYESGSVADAEYWSKFIGGGSNASLALGGSEFKDGPGFGPLGTYEFSSLKIKLKDLQNTGESTDDTPPDLLDLSTFGKSSFSLRFIDGPDKITYSGDVSSLEALAASGIGSDADVAVPLPPSLFGCLGGFGLLWLRRFRAERRFGRLDQRASGPASGRLRLGAS
ncbi:hypothetical protein R3X27_14030 [Tropicimonas sp. TH_r6]|uniref:hypothetical protein n=1 Tax=Tropicimonas sp. TH_r6 TaxID=3082085 RepID=UPI002952E4A8|nr:hypothetical protein [Tropicimonas sp. TH_r6]MDV7143801.1 hypothetical protein [Tropicimonas sp. TH_r6]